VLLQTAPDGRAAQRIAGSNFSTCTGTSLPAARPPHGQRLQPAARRPARVGHDQRARQARARLHARAAWRGSEPITLPGGEQRRFLADGDTVILRGRCESDGVRVGFGEVRALDLVQWSKFSDASWSRDSKGFFYTRYDEPAAGATLVAANYFPKIYYHRVGTAQSEDTLVYHRPDQKEWGFGAEVTEDGRLLLISVSKGTDPRNMIFYKRLDHPLAPVIELVDEFVASFDLLGNDGDVLYFKTDHRAPLGRVIAIDVTAPAEASWREVLLERGDALRPCSTATAASTSALTPSFSVANAGLDGDGRRLRVANLRGGGEYGRSGTTPGGSGNKQNVFDDFIAAAEYLIDERHTPRSPEARDHGGSSNGGLLVGACMTQRPDLFGAALPASA
jgi:prolyl oligopeptidase PreP (S9A serine peptidase family)